MSYATQSQLAQDQDFINRCNAAASKEIPAASPTNPLSYVQLNIWKLAAAPGFDAKYESAQAAGIGRPGWEASVITDQDILSAMQALLAQVPPEPVPTP
ncbi:MAG TPA: hypothetical protein VH482_14890 [Thermomicrobiales bacterium]|jgi:hypothetical protein